MIFGMLNPEKIWHQQLVHLPTSPVYCSHFTLGNQKKSFFKSIIHTYFILFTLSQKKTNFYPLNHHTWKMLPHYLVKCKTFLIWLKVMMRSSKHWWLWEEPVAMCGNWNVKQATSHTASVQSDHLLHVYMLPVFFATDQLHSPPRCGENQPI